MYLQRLEDGTTRLLQVVVVFPTLPADGSWWSEFHRRAVTMAGLPAVTTGLRLVMDEDGGARLLVAATVAEPDEAILRKFAAGFAWLEGIAGGSTAFPQTAEEFAGRAADFPASCCRMIPAPLSVPQGFWLAQAARLAPYLPALMEEARNFGYAFGYQALFRPYTADPERLRRVGRNLIGLRGMPGLRPAILTEQKRLAEGLHSASLLVEEVVGTGDAPDAERWLLAAMARIAAPRRAPFGLPDADFTLLASGGDDGLGLLLHDSLLNPEGWAADELQCGQATTESLRQQVLALRPPLDARAPARGAAAEPESPPGLPPGTPLPPLSGGPNHVFISYARADTDRMLPLVQGLCDAQLPVWFDSAIRVGEKWIEVLERKIEEAGLVVALLSRSAVASRYCRREITYADVLAKPVLPVFLEAVDLREGLNFTLHQTHQLRLEANDFEQQLIQRVVELLQRG